MSKLQNRPINDHDYDFPSLEVAYTGNMQNNMRIYEVYAAYMCCIFH